MNQPLPSSRRLILLSVSLMITVVLLAGMMGVFVLSDHDLRQAIRFAHTAVEIEQMYPGQVDFDELYHSAMDAMVANLDRYSSFVPAGQFKQIDEEMTGGYGGIGVSVLEHDDGLLVMSVREHGPASEAGLLTGDIIVQADSVRLAGLSVEASSRLLRGPEGSPVRLEIYRPVSEDSLSFTLKRRRINFMHIPFAGFTPDSILYLRLLDFDAGAADDVRDALDSLMHKHGSRPVGLILDLRGNPGGLFTEAYRTADLFLEQGQFIVGTDARSRWNREKHYATEHDVTGGLPMIVLVDRGSASAAEIVAGSLQQLGRAKLVGDTTFGKGLVQGFTRFPDGSGLRLTISRYYLAGNVYLNDFDSTLEEVGRGLVPDFYFRSDDRKEFPRRLESSLLLQQYAVAHQDEIVETGTAFGLSGDWVRSFREYATDHGFRFESRATRSAELVYDFARIEHVHIPTLKAVQNLRRLARTYDQRMFTLYGDYIRMRLREISFERKFGIYRAYADVIVRERSDIRFAATLLKGGV